MSTLGTGDASAQKHWGVSNLWAELAAAVAFGVIVVALYGISRYAGDNGLETSLAVVAAIVALLMAAITLWAVISWLHWSLDRRVARNAEDQREEASSVQRDVGPKPSQRLS